jgi:hypothetical protein
MKLFIICFTPSPIATLLGRVLEGTQGPTRSPVGDLKSVDLTSMTVGVFSQVCAHLH